MIYSADSQSEWVYQTPMLKTRKNASSVTVNDKIYVLGGENEQGACKSFAAYDTKKKVWEELPEYPGSETGICKASLISYKNEIYVIGGQTGLVCYWLIFIRRSWNRADCWNISLNWTNGRSCHLLFSLELVR